MKTNQFLNYLEDKKKNREIQPIFKSVNQRQPTVMSITSITKKQMIKISRSMSNSQENKINKIGSFLWKHNSIYLALPQPFTEKEIFVKDKTLTINENSFKLDGITTNNNQIQDILLGKMLNLEKDECISIVCYIKKNNDKISVLEKIKNLLFILANQKSKWNLNSYDGNTYQNLFSIKQQQSTKRQTIFEEKQPTLIPNIKIFNKLLQFSIERNQKQQNSSIFIKIKKQSGSYIFIRAIDSIFQQKSQLIIQQQIERMNVNKIQQVKIILANDISSIQQIFDELQLEPIESQESQTQIYLKSVIRKLQDQLEESKKQLQFYKTKVQQKMDKENDQSIIPSERAININKKQQLRKPFLKKTQIGVLR